MELIKPVLPHSYIVGLGNWIRQFPDNQAAEQALKTDVLSRDIRTLTIQEVTKCAQIRKPMDTEVKTDSKKGPGGAILYLDRSNDELSILHQAFVTNSKTVLCFACGKSGHIARFCRNEAAVKQWQRDKPEQYEKYHKANIPCKFGPNCKRKDSGCRYTHKPKGSARLADDDTNDETGVVGYTAAPASSTTVEPSEDGTFDMKEAHVCSTPLAPGDLLPIGVDSPALDSATPYRSLIGALSHLARFTRPDILFATFYFARFQKDPTQAHWKGAKRILRYLKHTRDLKTHVKKPENDQLELEAFCDADWGKKESKYKGRR